MRTTGLLCLLACLLADGEVWGQTAPVAAPQQAVQQAVAASADSVVRIETVGGVDLVEDQLTAAGPTSGVVVRADGLIITSRFNFLSRPASILVTLPDGRKFAARMLGEDQARMLTLLKIETGGLTPLPPAARESVRVGQTAIALGRTFDPEFPNVSVGIVSAVDRVWGRALQTDAKTSPVNYGGALIDLTGRCLGVIVPLDPGKEETTAGVEWYDSGIGFAIPMSDILRTLDQLAAGTNLQRGLMGVNFEDKGALSGEPRIQHVRPGSPAALAGLAVDDLLLSVNGKPAIKVNDVKHLLGPMYAGEEAVLRIRRGDQEREFTVKLTDELRPYQFPFAGILPERNAEGPPRVRDVIPGSPAAQAGLQPGDVILSLDGKAIPDRKELASSMLHHSPGEDLSLEVERAGMKVAATIKLAVFPDSLEMKPPSASIPANRPVKLPPTGRLSEKLPGTEASFWALVPDNYHPDVEWGLLIWLHPNGNGLEAETLRSWEAACRERGIILLGPRATEISGWSDDEAAELVKMMDWMKERYRIDPARVAVMGAGSATPFAARLAFRERDLVRGLMLVRGGFRSPPPENNPDSPLHFVLVPTDDAQRKSLDELAKALREMKLPTALLGNSDNDHGPFPASLVESLANWLDALDRI